MCRELLKKLTFFRRDEDGVQLVELAIVIPLLVLMFAAAAEFGRYFQEYTTLAKGTRIAARYLATARTDGTDDLGAQNLVVYGNLAGTGSPIVTGLQTTQVNIIRCCDSAGLPMTGGVPQTVTVQISGFNHTSLFNLGALTNSSLSLNTAVSPKVTMRYLLTQPPI